MTDHDVTAYLAGDSAASVTTEQRARLDAVRSVLADSAVWVQPDPALQESIVGAIVAEHRSTRPLQHRRPGRVAQLLLAAAAAVIVTVGVAVGLTQHPPAAVAYATELTGTPLAPGASGQAVLTRTASGWQIQLHATGLPRRDHGNYYQAWLSNTAGLLIPVGTFNEPDQVTLWAGVSPADYPTLTVTQQHTDTSPTALGPVVLTGTTHHTTEPQGAT